MVNYRTKISSHYHVVIYFALFHEKPASGLPEGAKVLWEQGQICFQHKDFNAIKQASQELAGKLHHQFLNLYAGRPLQAHQRKGIEDLCRQDKLTEIRRGKFVQLLDQISSIGNTQLHEFFKEKMGDSEEVIAFIMKDADRPAFQAALKPKKDNPPPPSSYIVNRNELNLEFDTKQMIRLQLLGILEDLSCYYEDVHLEGRGSSLYAVGPISDCRAFKQYAEKKLSDNQILKVDIYEPSVLDRISQLNKKMPSHFGAKVFTSDEVVSVCQQFQNLFHLDEPVNHMRKLQEQSGEFIMVYCSTKHKEATDKYIKEQLGLGSDDETPDSPREPIKRVPNEQSKSTSRLPRYKEVPKPQKHSSDEEDNLSQDSDRPKFKVKHKTSARQGDSDWGDKAKQKMAQDGFQFVGKKQQSQIKKEISSRTIMLNEYDEKDMKNWFSKNDYIDVSNLLVREGDDTITITLMGTSEDKSDPKLVGPFEMYFQYNKLVFLKDNEVGVAKKEMDAIKAQNPKYDITYVEGHGPYKYAELARPQNIKKQMGLIKKKNIRSGGQNIHPFRCIFFVGVHNIGNLIEKKIRDAINEDDRQRERAQDWAFVLQPQVASNILNKALKSIIEQKVVDILKYSECLRLDSIAWSDKVEVKVVPATNSVRGLFDLVKKQLKEAIEESLTSKKLDYMISINELVKYPEIDKKKFLFVYKPEGVYMIGFEVATEIHKVHSVIQSKKIEEAITIEGYLYPLVKDCLSQLAAKYKNDLSIREKAKDNEYIIDIKGLAHVVTAAVSNIHDQVLKVKDEISTFSLQVSQQDIRIIKEHDILAILEKNFPMKTEFASSRYEELQVTLPKGMITLTERTYDLVEGDKIVLALTQEDAVQCCPNERFRMNPEEPFAWNNARDVCLLKSMRHLPKMVGQLRQQAKMAMLVPENRPIRELFIELLENLALCESKESLLIYLCAPPSVVDPSDYTDLSREIQEGKLKLNARSINIVWSWQEGGKQTPYIPSAQLKINQAFSRGDTIVQLNEADLAIAEATHVFNKSSCTLTHAITKAVTSVTKLSPAFYMFDSATGKVQIPANQIAKIDSTSDDDVLVTLVLYEINLTTMVQTNKYTGFQRHVVKKGELPKQQNPLKDAKFQQKRAQVHVIKCQTHVSAGRISDKVSKKLQEQLSSYLTENGTIEVDSSHMTAEDIKKLCKENGVQIIGLKAKGNIYALEMKAYNKRDIELVKQQCEIKKLSTSKQEVSIKYPQTWVNGNDDVQLYEVKAGTPEFNKVMANFKIAVIKKLLRVENKLIWRKYMEEKKHLEYITKTQSIKELHLFHGTLSNDPKLIYEDKEEAFNINYSRETNYFGRGIYFAQEASYSHNYAYKGQRRVMMYCRVLVGTSQEMIDSQRSGEIKDTTYRDPTNKIRFESIHSKYEGSDIYVVYKSRRAFPEYVIEY